MNGPVEVTWRILPTIAHSRMLHVQVSEACIHFTFMYTVYHILPVLPIEYLINEHYETTTPFKLVKVTKPSVSHLRVLFFLFFVWNANVHVGTEALNMCHQAKRVFAVSLLEFYSIKKGVLFMYHTNRRSYLCTMLFLMRVYLVHLRTRRNHMNKLCLCDCLCCT